MVYLIPFNMDNNVYAYTCINKTNEIYHYKYTMIITWHKTIKS